MRNDSVSSRKETGGAKIRASFKAINTGKARVALDARALVVLDINGTYRRLTPEHAERLAAELVEAARAANLAHPITPPPEPPQGATAALPEAA